MNTQRLWITIAAFIITVLCGTVIKIGLELGELRTQVEYMKRDYEVLHGTVGNIEHKVNSECRRNDKETSP